MRVRTTSPDGGLLCCGVATLGDKVEQLVWRLENGELPIARQPKVVVVQIGTNGARSLPGAASKPGSWVHAMIGAPARNVPRSVGAAAQKACRRIPPCPHARHVMYRAAHAHGWTENG